MYLCILLEKYGECSYSVFAETVATQTNNQIAELKQ